jgi:hypothetical protein
VCPAPPLRPGISHGAHAVTACAWVFSSRTVRASCVGWHGTVSGKAGEPGAHDHDLYCCVLHYINEKTKKEEGRSNLPQINRLPRKLVRLLDERRIHRRVGSVSHQILRRAVSERSCQRYDMSVPSRSSNRKWIKLPIHDGILCITEPVKSRTQNVWNPSKYCIINSRCLAK